MYDESYKHQFDYNNPSISCQSQNSSNVLRGIHAQLTNAPEALVDNNENVLFNIILGPPSQNMRLNCHSGEFILLENKSYYVSWSVSIDGTDFMPNADFSLAIDGIPIASASSPLVTGLVSSEALISVYSAPERLSLKNTSGNMIRYSNTNVQANIVILEIT